MPILDFRVALGWQLIDCDLKFSSLHKSVPCIRGAVCSTCRADAAWSCSFPSCSVKAHAMCEACFRSHKSRDFFSVQEYNGFFPDEPPPSSPFPEEKNASRSKLVPRSSKNTPNSSPTTPRTPPSRPSNESKPLLEESFSSLQEFLASVGSEQHLSVLLSQKATLANLPYVEFEDLLEFGVDKLSARKIVFKLASFKK